MCTQGCKLGAPFSAKPAIPRPLLVHHVAKRLGISPRMVRHLAETGELPAYKAGRKIWRFLASDVEECRARRDLRYV
jgi:excisionase family DNA binding protein